MFVDTSMIQKLEIPMAESSLEQHLKISLMIGYARYAESPKTTSPLWIKSLI